MVDFGGFLNTAGDFLTSPAGGAIVGGALGALGGQDQAQTQTTQVELPENVRAGFDQLLAMSQPNQVAYQAAPTVRADTGFGGLFANPEMAELQRQSDIKAFSDILAQQEQAAQPQQQVADPTAPLTPDAPIGGNQEQYIIGLMEAQRLANQPSGKMNWNKQVQQDYRVGNRMTGPRQYKELLNPSVEGYENPYGAGDVQRTQTVSNLGQRALMGGSPENLIYGTPHSSPTNQEMQEKRQEYKQLTGELGEDFQALGYRPPKNSVGSIFGRYVLPALGAAAFTGGTGLAAGSGGAGATAHIGAYNAAQAVNQGKNLMRGLSAIRSLG